MKNFWKNLPRPFTVLAPMDGVTDVVFRQVVNEVGRPDVFFTEFVSCDGILSDGQKKVLRSLQIAKGEQPVVAQIWGNKPESFYAVAKLVKELGFSGVDINMGCPVKKVVTNGTCSALIRLPKLAGEIIQATKEGAGGLPVSVKTRIGFNTTEIEQWIRFLLKQDIAALSVHLRTVKELSQVPAHWELMPEIMKLRDEIAPETLIIGNGDITSLGEVSRKYKQYGCDGFMIGRGIFHNPWIFNPDVDLESVTVEERFALYLRHIELHEKIWKGSRPHELLRKFCKTYIQNFPGASDVRVRLMETKSLGELKSTVAALAKSVELSAEREGIGLTG